MDAYLGGTWWARLLLQRGVAAVYLCAFVSALLQFRALLGEHGLLPVPQLLTRVSFRQAPSVFHIHYSDRTFSAVAGAGALLSAALLMGVLDHAPSWLACATWLVVWCAYLSIVNVGQVFYGFGWESMLLEAGFFVSFLGPPDLAPAPLMVLALRWMLFRTELGAGLIKLRHDSCWRDLTCLYYHYETQPLPNLLSWYFHWLPRWVHRQGVVFSHFVQVVVPFGLFLPQPLSAAAGALIIGHQLLLVVSGNYSWLNWLTIVLGFSAFGDSTLHALLGLDVSPMQPPTLAFSIVQYVLAAITLALSIQPTINLVQKQQRMNYCYNALHLVNSYGAFGSVTRERYEIVIEGKSESDGNEWKEYEFRGKPGDPRRLPPQVAPYHLRLDWLMWFQSLYGFRDPERWFVRLVEKLLAGERAILGLLRRNPFPEQPPSEIRALLYLYRFTPPAERRETGAWWKRERVGEFYRRAA
ncbi:MAG: lipase maturation factor family protein [Polyangiales bacterium]